MQNLAHQEELGEKAFESYYYKNDPTQAAKISQLLKQSLSDANGIENPALQKHVKKLLTSLNHSINTYIKNPSNLKLTMLQSNLEEYKSTLDQYKK